MCWGIILIETRELYICIKKGEFERKRGGLGYKLKRKTKKTFKKY